MDAFIPSLKRKSMYLFLIYLLGCTGSLLPHTGLAAASGGWGSLFIAVCGYSLQWFLLLGEHGFLWHLAQQLPVRGQLPHCHDLPDQGLTSVP